jgi:hypothetical protein
MIQVQASCRLPPFEARPAGGHLRVRVMDWTNQEKWVPVFRPITR